ncbi:hypothetical protein SDC9_160588 [bioreactor metagenome]|uniref:Uncharacterized protein n=1 Tax=bioreactor metagenome TaxID=1076179 RepID=A0A645FG10_9ZZZZ
MALAAAELVREPTGVSGVETDLPHHLDQPGAPIRGHRPAGPDPPGAQRLGDAGPDSHPRVERGPRVLEDHLDRGPQKAQPSLGAPGELGAAEGDAAAGGPLESGHHPDQGRLARPGLPHDAEPLARSYVQAHVVDGGAAGVPVVTYDVAHPVDRLLGVGHVIPPGRPTTLARCAQSSGTAARPVIGAVRSKWSATVGSRAPGATRSSRPVATSPRV